ncbi:uncharacterized protein LOC134531708 isoform X2 [Bacillus rossius redtenbacheri]|uniref:uncharacterized protein LOC134531708 isoform X2 n=1 Tax=Bacillus rossius redtenbacheri TaxID=93214 RepID=UPI002FDD90EE
MEQPDDPKPKRKRNATSKKLDCPAVIIVRRVRVYPELSSTGSKRDKCGVIRKLKVALKEKSSLVSFLRFYIKASSGDTHNHPITTKANCQKSQKHSSTTISRCCKQKIHPELVTEIKKLVEQGITATRDVKLLLDQYVQTKFSGDNVPRKPSKAFSPEEYVINAHVYSVIFSKKRDQIDQEALQQTINEWKNQYSDDLFFYRPYEFMPNGDVPTLLFCHQTKWQQKLLLRYGRMCLLDAAYKTMNYGLPLFFLAVKTNVGYSVVGTFVVQSESTTLIKEALNIFKEWLPEWQPEFWVTDSNDIEIIAVETTFHGSTVYLDAFHREQAWLSWVRESGNVTPGDEEKILSMWRTIAASTDESEIDSNVEKMNTSNIIQQNPHIYHYFATIWLPEAHRWVQALIDKEFDRIVHISNGFESQNEDLEHFYLCYNVEKSLTAMLKTIINSYLPDGYRKYCLNNSSFNVLYSDVPSYLINRPQHFVKHVLKRIIAAHSDFCKDSITEVSEGIFAVQSSTDKTKFYCVDFNAATCNCTDFMTFRYPCKHMCAIFEFLPAWSFLRLNSLYTNSPYITIDLDNDYTVTGVVNTSSPVAQTSKNDWTDKTQPTCDMTEEHGVETSQPTTADTYNLNEEHTVEFVTVHPSSTVDSCDLTEEYTVEIATSQPSSTCGILLAQQNFRNTYKSLIDLSYVCSDEQFLIEKTTLLLEIHKQMQEKTKSCSRLPLQN